MSDDGSVAIQAIADRYGLSPGQCEQYAAILAQIAADEHAPTTVRDPAAVVDAHISDSLAALELGILQRCATVADLGTGAGFPGLALAVALPHCEVALIESRTRRCAFIERICSFAGVANARAVCVRVEEWHEGRGRNDVALARALAPQPVVLEYAAPLLGLGGTLIDWRGRRDADEERRAAAAAAEVGLRLAEIRRVEPYAGVRDHYLHVFEKVAETPSHFPRRAGIARKRPLGNTAALRP